MVTLTPLFCSSVCLLQAKQLARHHQRPHQGAEGRHSVGAGNPQRRGGLLPVLEPTGHGAGALFIPRVRPGAATGRPDGRRGRRLSHHRTLEGGGAPLSQRGALLLYHQDCGSPQQGVHPFVHSTQRGVLWVGGTPRRLVDGLYSQALIPKCNIIPDFSKICFETLLDFSLLRNEGFETGAAADDHDAAAGSTALLESSLTNKLAITSLLQRFKEVLVDAIDGEKLNRNIPLQGPNSI